MFRDSGTLALPRQQRLNRAGSFGVDHPLAAVGNASIERLPGQKGACAIAAHGFPKEKALRHFAMMITQKSGLSLGFHPFRGHVQTERPREAEQGGDDGGVFRIRFQIPDEGAVDLDFGNRKLLQMYE